MNVRAMLMSLGLGTAATVLSGCQVVGGAIDNYQRESTHEVKAEYRGLEGKTFAVVVSADRYIQSDFPDVVDYLTTKVTERLSMPTNRPTPGGYVPSKEVLTYLYDHPGWTTKSMTDVAKGLGGVDCIVLVELSEFRLREPGNQYEWDGVASGTVAVVSMQSNVPDEYVFQKSVTVKFPDKKGYGPEQLSQSAVMSALALRFIDRTTWNFYDHEEPYRPEY
jgi:hypothetical protein